MGRLANPLAGHSLYRVRVRTELQAEASQPAAESYVSKEGAFGPVVLGHVVAFVLPTHIAMKKGSGKGAEKEGGIHMIICGHL